MSAGRESERGGSSPLGCPVGPVSGGACGVGPGAARPAGAGSQPTNSREPGKDGGPGPPRQADASVQRVPSPDDSDGKAVESGWQPAHGSAQPPQRESGGEGPGGGEDPSHPTAT
jgi:hypothetical protein